MQKGRHFLDCTDLPKMHMLNTYIQQFASILLLCIVYQRNANQWDDTFKFKFWFCLVFQNNTLNRLIFLILYFIKVFRLIRRVLRKLILENENHFYGPIVYYVLICHLQVLLNIIIFWMQCNIFFHIYFIGSDSYDFASVVWNYRFKQYWNLSICIREVPSKSCFTFYSNLFKKKLN